MLCPQVAMATLLVPKCRYLSPRPTREEGSGQVICILHPPGEAAGTAERISGGRRWWGRLSQELWQGEEAGLPPGEGDRLTASHRSSDST